MLNCNECEFEEDKVEEMRLLELYNYEMLHTPREETIDSITKLTQIICKTPMCLVSLLNEKKQWFKSRQGLDVPDTDRDISFCKYAIKQDTIFEVKNALEDPRFVNNPLVTGFPHIRHYAGMPLKSPNGYNIGTLCVIDTKPGELNDDQKIALQTLAKQVISQFEMKKVLKELKLANDKSQKLSLVKDEFLSNMSHELRTPLNAIYGFTEILQNSVKDCKQREYLDIIKSSVEILISIINDILDFSKIELGKLVIEKKPFSLKKALKEIFELLKQKAIEKNITLGFNIRSNVPDEIVGDKVRLNQILVNLIGNAIKFTNKGKVEVIIKRVKNTLIPKRDEECEGSSGNNNNNEDLDEICFLNNIANKNKKDFQKQCKIISSFTSNPEKRESSKNQQNEQDRVDLAELEFNVKDSGIGITEDKLEKIFERFEQASSDITRKYGGSGLGLSISKNLVELQGGEIKVKSVHQKGSEFSFRIAYDYQKKEKYNNKKDQCFSNVDELKGNSDKDSSCDSFELTKFEDSFIFDTNSIQQEKEKCIEKGDLNSNKECQLREKENQSNDESFVKDANNFKCMKLNKTDQLEKIKENIYFQLDESQKINILLCEDNNFNIKLVEKILFDSPFRDNINLDIAFNGRIGGEMVKNNPEKYDLILMDLQMPEMNGLETSEYIRKQLKLSVPIVAMTANICSIERKKCLDQGINNYFTKPFNKKEFFDCFNNLLKNKIDKIKDIIKKESNKSLNRSVSPNKKFENKKTDDKIINKEGSDTIKNLDQVKKYKIGNSYYNSSKNLIKELMSSNQKIIKESKNNYISFQYLIDCQKSKINNFNLNLKDKGKNEINSFLMPMDSKNISEKINNNFNNTNTNSNFNSISKNTNMPEKSHKVCENTNEDCSLNSKKDPLPEDFYGSTTQAKNSFHEKLLDFKKDFFSSTIRETTKIKYDPEFNNKLKAFNDTSNNLKTNRDNNYTFNRKKINYDENNTVLPPNIYLPKTRSIDNYNNKRIMFKNNSILKNELIKIKVIGAGNIEFTNSYFGNKNKQISYKVFDNFYKDSLNPVFLNNKTKDEINKFMTKKSNEKPRIRKFNTTNAFGSVEEEESYKNLIEFNNQNKMENYDNKSLSKIKDSIRLGNSKNKDLPIINNVSNYNPNKNVKSELETKNKNFMEKLPIQSIHSVHTNENDDNNMTSIQHSNKTTLNENKNLETQNKQFNINNTFNFNIFNEKNFLNIGNEFKINLDKEKIDYETFKDFTGEDPETTREIIESFLKEFPILIDELESAIISNNFDEISKICHKMKSPISLFGLNIVKEKLMKVDIFSKFIMKSMHSLSEEYPSLRLTMKMIYNGLNDVK